MEKLKETGRPKKRKAGEEAMTSEPVRPPRLSGLLIGLVAGLGVFGPLAVLTDIPAWWGYLGFVIAAVGVWTVEKCRLSPR